MCDRHVVPGKTIYTIANRLVVIVRTNAMAYAFFYFKTSFLFLSKVGLVFRLQLATTVGIYLLICVGFVANQISIVSLPDQGSKNCLD